MLSSICGCNACGESADKQKMYLHAHRGEPSLAPQNTCESIALAFQLDARMIETDCHITKSGDMVIIHGEKELKEVWGIDKNVVDLTADDLKNSKLARPEKFDAKYAACKIPTLAEILAVIPKNKYFELEIKTYGEGFAKKFDDERAKAGLNVKNVIVTSFKEDAIKDFKQKYPQYETLFIVNFKKDKSGKLPYTAAELIAKGKELGVSQFAIGSYRNVDRVFVKALQDAGFKVGVWQVENLEDLAVARELGADRICSNFASQLRKKYNLINEICLE